MCHNNEARKSTPGAYIERKRKAVQEEHQFGFPRPGKAVAKAIRYHNRVRSMLQGRLSGQRPHWHSQRYVPYNYYDF